MRTGNDSRPPVAGRVPGSVLRVLLRSVVSVNIEPRAVLFHAGDEGSGCYFLRSGAVKASVVAKDGQERLLAVLGPGSLIGELSLFDGQPRSATVSALRPARLLHLSRARFFALADQNPQIYRQSLRLLTDRLRKSNDAMVAQGTVGVLGRVARAFSSLAQGLGETDARGRVILAQRITQSDIAGMAGVARENANRAVAELIGTGVLSRSKSAYTVENLAELSRLSEI